MNGNPFRIIGDAVDFRKSEPPFFDFDHSRPPVQGFFADIKSTYDKRCRGMSCSGSLIRFTDQSHQKDQGKNHCQNRRFHGILLTVVSLLFSRLHPDVKD